MRRSGSDRYYNRIRPERVSLSIPAWQSKSELGTRFMAVINRGQLVFSGFSNSKLHQMYGEKNAVNMLIVQTDKVISASGWPIDRVGKEFLLKIDASSRISCPNLNAGANAPHQRSTDVDRLASFVGQQDTNIDYVVRSVCVLIREKLNSYRHRTRWCLS